MERPGQDAATDPIAVARAEIDGIDQAILRLVRQRTLLALGIAADKHRRKESTYAPLRHAEVVDNYREGAREQGVITPIDAIHLAEVVQQISRTAQDAFRAQLAADAAAARQELTDLAGRAAEAAANPQG